MTDARIETGAGRLSVIRRQATYDTWHFAAATRVGNTVWVSGRRGFNAADEILDDPAAQVRIAFENLQAVLRAAGAELDERGLLVDRLRVTGVERDAERLHLGNDLG